MNEQYPKASPQIPHEEPAHYTPDVVPWGYRPGIITAITVFLARGAGTRCFRFA